MGIRKSQLSKCVVAICLLALTNFVAGRLGLLLAVPPGYSTAVFPPSGIALGAILLFGFRVWPGVFLGSFFLASYGRYELPNIFLVAASIAFGSVLQAIVGAWWIRRSVGFPTPLDEEVSIGKFYLLGGPISCLISATWGNSTLSVMGWLTSDFLFNWFNWWVGDTIGVLIFTPLMLVIFGQPRRIWSARRLSVGIPLALVFAGAVLVFFFARNQQTANMEREFRQRTNSYRNTMKREIDRHIDTLRAIQSFLSATDEVTKAGFASYVSRILAEDPGVRAVSWNPRVLHGNRAIFEEEARKRVDESFVIRERNSRNELRRSPTSDEYVVVTFIEPWESNKEAIGFNVASESNCRTAIETARDSGEPVATSCLELVQDVSDPAGVLLFMGVYQRNMPPQDQQERRSTIRGYAVMALRISEVVAQSSWGLYGEGLELRIVDEGRSAADLKEQLMYGSARPPDADLRTQLELKVAGRTWRLEFFATDEFQVANSWEAWVVLTGGLSFTSLLGFVLLSITGRSSRVEQMVEQRTKELLHEQLLLQELIKLQDRERQMVAQDIHDGFVQEIVGAHMLVESANHDLGDKARNQIEKASLFLQKGIDEARRLIGDLRPMVIEEHGVVEAIKHLIADQEKQYGMTVIFVHDVEFDRIDPTLEGVIFRIVQEALRNVVHHAETRHAVVRLEQHENNLTIEIRDSGKGFDPKAVPASRFGVRGIQDRARIFGGSACIESAPGEGTIVRVELPIADQDQAPLPPPDFYI